MFTSSTKRKIRKFHVVVVQRRQRKVQKSVQSCCFSNLNGSGFFCCSCCRRRRCCFNSLMSPRGGSRGGGAPPAPSPKIRPCDPGSIPDLNEKQQCWLSFLLSSQKTTIPNSNSIQFCGRATSESLFEYSIYVDSHLTLILPFSVSWSGRGKKNLGSTSALIVVFKRMNNTLCRVNLRGIPIQDGWTTLISTGIITFVKFIFLPEGKNEILYNSSLYSWVLSSLASE